ncbi:dickkopf-related protein 3-like isoform X1 [Stylophora pistillata]|uniref:Dickkopf-related protein 3 n=2 Tax=Stylophora pistillata TaxID=50429 RepID=A0A2B4SMY5_STYPI|nr:dickkopf-related protein 3-like isoform X1 [Stylophora pistillata]PFX29882.1 Dickkopf-related protein 3 [Stylophora pistillata]
MFTKKPKAFLLLFGCLLQTCFSLGKQGKTKGLIPRRAKSSGSEKNRKMNIDQKRNHEKYASKSFGRKNTAKMEIHRSVMGLHRNEIIHGRSHNGRLMQEIRRRQMIAPGYYQAECSEKKPCKEGMYCNVLYCEKCHKLNVGCNSKEQCCKGLVCTFGRCEKKSEGDPGTFCEKDSDCKEACCVLEPTINSHLPICKPTLEEYHQCAAILYRKIWVGEKPDCGPCKPGLECVQKGVFGSHEVCMKPDK